MGASDWKRVTRSNPCPICERPDWCLVASDGTAAICSRVESGKRCGEAGYLHRLADFDNQNRRHLRSIGVEIRQAADESNMNDLAERYRLAVDSRLLAGLADNTVRRRCGIAKQFFTAALRRELIPSNPFSDLVAAVKANTGPMYFVTRDEADKVLDACPNAE